MEKVQKKKKFRLFDAVLASVCIVLVAESAAPAASIGNMQYFWWIFLLIAFFIPYGLINAELGTTYTGEGGLYDWVKKAFGKRNGARVAWYYWVNFPIWMSSLAVLFTTVLTSIFNIEMSIWSLLAIQLVFIWLTIFASNFKLTESKWLINGSAILKSIIMLAIGGLGIYVALTKGVATSSVDISPLEGLSFISIILFNFMGFEVVSSFAQDMENPKKEIPKALIIGGVLIAVFYLLAAFGMGVAIPANELSVDSGLIDSFAILIGSATGWPIIVIGLMFMATLVGNLISWSPGINFVAAHAAKDGAMPKFFAKENKNGIASNVNLTNGFIASALVIIAAVLEATTGNASGFWTFFALNVFTLLASYLFLFPAFLKLRKIDSKTERPYKVPGKPAMIKVITFVPMILLILALVFICFPYNADSGSLEPDWLLIAGVVISFIIGEILGQIAVMKTNKNKEKIA